MKHVIIEECDEGYLVKSGFPMKTYAVSKDRLVQKVKELLGITHFKTDKIDELRELSAELIKENTEKFTKENSTESPFSQIHIDVETDASRSAVIQHNETDQDTPFILKQVSFPVFTSDLQSHSSGKMHWIISKDQNIQIKRDGYFLNLKFSLNDIKYLYDHKEEAKKIIRHFGKLSSNRAIVLRMFMQEVPWEKVNPAATQEQKKEELQGQEDGTCDDVMFGSCANNSPENCKFCIPQAGTMSRYEDKNKVAAMKPSPPSMKFGMGSV